MRGLSIPAAIIVAPGVNGWSRELDKREPVDLKQARPAANGFSLALASMPSRM